MSEEAAPAHPTTPAPHRDTPHPGPRATATSRPADLGPAHPHAVPSGGPPFPFRQFVVKMHGRCNLACRYCYLYAGPDHGWRDRPAAAPPAVLERTAQRIAEHARAHGLRALSLVLHGGEPLLAGAGTLARFAGRVRRLVPDDCAVHATVQTNATLLTERRLAVLARHGVRVGISLDGGLAEHNTQRTDHAGRPSWPAAARGARLLAAHHPRAYAGILTVVDPASDPVELYESLLGLRPPAVDLLLPHGNWSAPPRGWRPGGTPYGDWLSAVFDRWWSAGRRETRVRLFEECLALLLGLPAATESLGLAPFDALVVETDGSIEQVDSLKSCYAGAAETGLDVFRHPFDAALDHPGVAARQAGTAALAAACRACPLLTVCGGGHYAHRYRAGHGFANPSVYCADLQRLIRHVAARLTEARPAPAADRDGTPGGARRGASAPRRARRGTRHSRGARHRSRHEPRRGAGHRSRHDPGRPRRPRPDRAPCGPPRPGYRRDGLRRPRRASAVSVVRGRRSADGSRSCLRRPGFRGCVVRCASGRRLRGGRGADGHRRPPVAASAVAAAFVVPASASGSPDVPPAAASVVPAVPPASAAASAGAPAGVTPAAVPAALGVPHAPAPPTAPAAAEGGVR